MNEGEVLVDCTVADARKLARVQEVIHRLGWHALAGRPANRRARENVLLQIDRIQTRSTGKSHILPTFIRCERA